MNGAALVRVDKSHKRRRGSRTSKWDASGQKRFVSVSHTDGSARGTYVRARSVNGGAVDDLSASGQKVTIEPGWRNSRLRVDDAVIDSFRRLGNDWNGQGSEVPNNHAVFCSHRALETFHSFGLLPVRIAPSAEGGVGFVFGRGIKVATVEYLNSGEAVAVTSDGAGNITAWELKATKSLRTAANRIREFLDA